MVGVVFVGFVVLMLLVFRIGCWRWIGCVFCSDGFLVWSGLVWWSWWLVGWLVFVSVVRYWLRCVDFLFWSFGSFCRCYWCWWIVICGWCWCFLGKVVVGIVWWCWVFWMYCWLVGCSCSSCCCSCFWCWEWLVCCWCLCWSICVVLGCCFGICVCCVYYWSRSFVRMGSWFFVWWCSCWRCLNRFGCCRFCCIVFGCWCRVWSCCWLVSSGWFYCWCGNILLWSLVVWCWWIVIVGCYGLVFNNCCGCCGFNLVCWFICGWFCDLGCFGNLVVFVVCNCWIGWFCCCLGLGWCVGCWFWWLECLDRLRMIWCWLCSW